MKITIYELLGLIKEGKAPKKIKGGNNIYIYDEFEKDYVDDFYEDILKRKTRHTGDILYLNYLCKKLGSDEYQNITKQLNYEVEVIEEIIEEEKEIENIIELEIPEIDTIENERICRAEYRINALIKNQKKIIDLINDMRDKE